MTDNKSTPMSEPMTMEEFKALSGAGITQKSEQRKLVEAMAPGDILKISHKGLRHKSANSCGLRAAIQHASQVSGYRYLSRHLPDGRVAVACFEKGD
jgi:hypothetical protein